MRTPGACANLASVQILPATPADASDLRDLHLVTWAVTYRDRASEPWYAECIAAHAKRDWAEILRVESGRGGGVLTARLDGRIVGLCQHGPAEDPEHVDEGVGHIYRLYVHPARQRAGVGRALLTAALESMREASDNLATLWVLETDLGAQAFYERLGWTADGSRKAGPPADLRYVLAL